MTGNAIKAKSEALGLHELSSKDLDAVSGGRHEYDEDKRLADAAKVLAQLLASA